MKNNPKKSNFFLAGLELPFLYLYFIKEVLFQKKFLKKHIEKELQVFKNSNDPSLNERDFNKIISYYGLGVPSVFGYAAAILRNRKLTQKERLSLTFLGGISGLLDDFFDDPAKSPLNLEKFVTAPETLKPVNNAEKLLQYFYLKGLENSKNPQEIKFQALKVYRSQQESLQQRKEKNSASFLKEITWKKGGNAFLYYLASLNYTAKKSEENVYYQLGGLLQLGNDIFDIWEDKKEGWQTLATTFSSVKDLKNLFEAELLKTFSLTKKTHYKEKDIQKFNRFVLLAISRVFVCLDQFQQLEKESGGTFCPPKYSRNQLICDMQKGENQLKMIKYYFKKQSIYI